MTISRSQHLVTSFAQEQKNSYTMSATMSVGDLCIVSINYRNASGYRFAAPTWNGQSFIPLTADINQRDTIFQTWYLVANSSTTADISATATGFVYINAMFAVYSKTGAGWVIPAAYTDSYADGTFRNPSYNTSLSSSKKAVTVMNGSGWNSGYSDTLNAWDTNAPIAAVADVNHTVSRPVNRMYFGEADGSGAVTLSYSATGGQQPGWGYTVVTLEEISQSLTIGSDLVPSASRTDTCTGFVNGAATLSFSGVSVPVTIASGSFTWTVPMLADGVTWPRLPATGQTITLTQGGTTANTTANINLPTGHQTLRVGDVVGGAVANFAGIVTDNDRMLGYHFLAAGNPLTTDDTAYFVTSDNYWVYRNGDVGADTASLPRTDTLYVQDTTTGVISSHSVVFTEAGVTAIGGLSVAGLSNSGLSNSGLSVTGL